MMYSNTGYIIFFITYIFIKYNKKENKQMESTMYVAVVETESLIGKITYLVLADILDKDDPKEVISVKLSKIRGFVNMSAELVDLTKLSEYRGNIFNAKFKFFVYYEDKYVWIEYPNKKIFNNENSSCKDMLTLLYNANDLKKQNIENISRNIKTELLALKTHFVYINSNIDEIDLSNFKNMDLTIIIVNPDISELFNVYSYWLNRIKGTDMKLSMFLLDSANYMYKVTCDKNIKIEKI